MASWERERRQAGLFADTPWGLITYPGRACTERQRRAWAEFYRIYWGPIFGLVCGRGFAVAEAEDLTQEFLLHFLASHALVRARREKGRFRDFLGAALRHYLINRQARVQTQKRGGDLIPVEPKVLENVSLPGAPQQFICACDRAWAGRVIARAFARVQTHYGGERQALFQALQPGLIGESEQALDYEELSARLRRSAATLRSEAKRLRALLRAEVLREVGERGELEDLREILRGR